MQLFHLVLQSALAFCHPFLLIERAKVKLFHELEHVDLEQHDVHERATRFDLQRAVRPCLGVNEAAVQLEDAQEFDEVASNELARPYARRLLCAIEAFEVAPLFTAQRAERREVFELCGCKAQRAEMI